MEQPTQQDVTLELTQQDFTLELDLLFEQKYAEILALVLKNKHASCFEMMKEFHISYTEAVNFMHTLVQRGIVGEATSEVRGPRPLLETL